MGKQWKQRQTIFLCSKITADGDCRHEIKRRLLSGRKVMTNIDSILKSRDITLSTKVRVVESYDFSSSYVWMWELNYKESWALKNWCFWTVVLEKTLETPLDCKEIQPVHPQGVYFITLCLFLECSYLIWTKIHHNVQFNSGVQLCPTFCDPMDCSTPGIPVHHQLPKLTQTHVHWVGDAIQGSHHLSSPSRPAFNLSQHQGLFKWVSSSHQVAKVLEFQLQYQSFQWLFRTDFL